MSANVSESVRNLIESGVDPSDIILRALRECDSPWGMAEVLAGALDAASYDCAESASECSANWQDPGAGKLWHKLSRELEQDAARYRKLSRE